MSRGMSENCNLIGLPKSKTADSAQPRYRSIVTPCDVRAGSGHETMYYTVINMPTIPRAGIINHNRWESQIGVQTLYSDLLEE